ncbi:MAG: hypothetical protein HC767_05730 [Akkermansiaceae bacterium]|nr:hypothetical protein [Akkermansiaceae bacterium]
METFKPTIFLRGKAALLATACMISPTMGGEPFRGSSSADHIEAKVLASLDEAQELLKRATKLILPHAMRMPLKPMAEPTNSSRMHQQPRS